MRITPRLLTLFTASALVGSAVAHAQPLGQPALGDQQVVGWLFTPTMAVGGAWDDNILLAHADDNPVSDYATPVSPSLSLDYRGRRTQFSSHYGGSFLVYRSVGELNSFQQQLHTTLQHRATRRVTMSARQSFTMAPTTDVLELSGVPFFRVGSRAMSAGGGLEAAITRHTSLRGSYMLNSVSFATDDPTNVDLQGGHAHEAIVEFRRMLSRRLAVGGQYELRRAILAEGEDRFNIETGTAVIQYEVAPTVTVSGLAGVARLGGGLSHESRTGPALQAGITHRARRAAVSALYRRSFIPSWGFGGTFQNEEWQGTVHVPFARNRAYVHGTIARVDADSLNRAQPSLRTVLASSTLGYRATRWLNVEGFYARAQQDSQVAGGDRLRNEIGFRVVAARPVRLR